MLHARVKVSPSENISKSERSNFLFDGNLFFTIMKIVGCFPIVKINGRVKFKWFCWTTLYTVTYNLLWTSYSIWCCYIIFGNLKQEDFSFEEASFYCSLLGIPIMQILPTLTFFEAGNFASYLDAWADFQEIYERVTLKKIEIKHKSYKLFGLLIAPAFIIYTNENLAEGFHVLLVKYNLEPTSHGIMLRLVFYNGVVISVYGYLWYVVTSAIHCTSEALIQDIKALHWKRTRSLHNHIILWFNLRQLCLRLGSMLAWTYCYVISICLFISLPMMYTGAIQAQQGNSATLLASFNTLLSISVFVEVAHRAVEKVSAKFETQVTELISKVTDITCENELLRFAEKIATHPVIVYLGGFFPLNRSINPAMYSSLITYLIIIIQFRDPDHQNSHTQCHCDE